MGSDDKHDREVLGFSNQGGAFLFHHIPPDPGPGELQLPGPSFYLPTNCKHLQVFFGISSSSTNVCYCKPVSFVFYNYSKQVSKNHERAR